MAIYIRQQCCVPEFISSFIKDIGKSCSAMYPNSRWKIWTKGLPDMWKDPTQVLLKRHPFCRGQLWKQTVLSHLLGLCGSFPVWNSIIICTVCMLITLDCRRHR